MLYEVITNQTSVSRALTYLGIDNEITADPARIASAKGISYNFV